MLNQVKRPGAAICRPSPVRGRTREASAAAAIVSRNARRFIPTSGVAL
jgi:hypothetical protein